MRILHNTFAVFWTRPGYKTQFHADVGRGDDIKTPAECAAWFKRLFPGDIVLSVRDSSGRFLPFKSTES